VKKSVLLTGGSPPSRLGARVKKWCEIEKKVSYKWFFYRIVIGAIQPS
jgi:hypothetical protein